jgi:hypothetical protein
VNGDGLCVEGVLLERLLAVPVGSVVRNGPSDSPMFFVKSGVDEWRPCGGDGVVLSVRGWWVRFGDPLWLGPFGSAQLHAFGLEVLR